MPTHGRKIPKKEVVRLVKKFKKSGEKSNTKSVWYSLLDLHEIINLINLLNDPSQQKVGDGVRLYFGRYPKNNPEPGKVEKNTIVFVPTFSLGGVEIHHDYISATEVRDISDNQVKDPDTGPYPFADEGYDHGSLCPNDCEGAYVGNA